MILGNHRLAWDICVKINKEKINRLNDKLNRKNHVLSARSDLSICPIMYRTSSLINKHGMHILYYSLFLPDIMYCAEVWGNTYATNIHCLVLLQKKVIRILFDAKRLDHIELLFHNVHNF